jgi:hypothetical protein
MFEIKAISVKAVDRYFLLHGQMDIFMSTGCGTKI